MYKEQKRVGRDTVGDACALSQQTPEVLPTRLHVVSPDLRHEKFRDEPTKL